jgi:hypothetical protein
MSHVGEQTERRHVSAEVAKQQPRTGAIGDMSAGRRTAGREEHAAATTTEACAPRQPTLTDRIVHQGVVTFSGDNAEQRPP